jgi:hypothetical protein
MRLATGRRRNRKAAGYQGHGEEPGIDCGCSGLGVKTFGDKDAVSLLAWVPGVAPTPGWRLLEDREKTYFLPGAVWSSSVGRLLVGCWMKGVVFGALLGEDAKKRFSDPIFFPVDQTRLVWGIWFSG